MKNDNLLLFLFQGWDSQNVYDWIAGLNEDLSKFAGKYKEQEIDGSKLLNFTDKHYLRNVIGITDEKSSDHMTYLISKIGFLVYDNKYETLQRLYCRACTVASNLRSVLKNKMSFKNYDRQRSSYEDTLLAYINTELKNLIKIFNDIIHWLARFDFITSQEDDCQTVKITTCFLCMDLVNLTSRVFKGFLKVLRETPSPKNQAPSIGDGPKDRDEVRNGKSTKFNYYNEANHEVVEDDFKDKDDGHTRKESDGCINNENVCQKSKEFLKKRRESQLKDNQLIRDLNSTMSVVIEFCRVVIRSSSSKFEPEIFLTPFFYRKLVLKSSFLPATFHSSRSCDELERSNKTENRGDENGKFNENIWGIDIKVENDWHVISYIAPESPASLCGRLDLGDQVLMISNKLIIGWEITNVKNLLLSSVDPPSYLTLITRTCTNWRQVKNITYSTQANIIVSPGSDIHDAKKNGYVSNAPSNGQNDILASQFKFSPTTYDSESSAPEIKRTMNIVENILKEQSCVNKFKCKNRLMDHNSSFSSSDYEENVFKNRSRTDVNMLIPDMSASSAQRNKEPFLNGGNYKRNHFQFKTMKNWLLHQNRRNFFKNSLDCKMSREFGNDATITAKDNNSSKPKFYFGDRIILPFKKKTNPSNSMEIGGKRKSFLVDHLDTEFQQNMFSKETTTKHSISSSDFSIQGSKKNMNDNILILSLKKFSAAKKMVKKLTLSNSAKKLNDNFQMTKENFSPKFSYTSKFYKSLSNNIIQGNKKNCINNTNLFGSKCYGYQLPYRNFEATENGKNMNILGIPANQSVGLAKMPYIDPKNLDNKKIIGQKKWDNSIISIPKRYTISNEALDLADKLSNVKLEQQKNNLDKSIQVSTKNDKGLMNYTTWVLVKKVDSPKGIHKTFLSPFSTPYLQRFITDKHIEGDNLHYLSSSASASFSNDKYKLEEEIPIKSPDDKYRQTNDNNNTSKSSAFVSSAILSFLPASLKTGWFQTRALIYFRNENEIAEIKEKKKFEIAPAPYMYLQTPSWDRFLNQMSFKTETIFVPDYLVKPSIRMHNCIKFMGQGLVLYMAMPTNSDFKKWLDRLKPISKNYYQLYLTLAKS
ncbi:unnamed protein product [Gordionus sp. m RMFG-2023]